MKESVKKSLMAIVIGVGVAAPFATSHEAPVPAMELRPAWTEFKWPFAVDQWGIGRAFVCEAAACGVEVNVYVRPKIGFCKCATGVDDDDELDRVGDNALIAADTSALAPGRVVDVGWMKGRSRPYGVPDRARNRILSVGFNDQCDVIVAVATLGRGNPDTLEPAVIAFLSSERVLRWVRWLIT